MHGMRRNAKSITTSPEIVKHIDGLTEANFQLLTKLVPWLNENERVERKFRYVMLHKLTRIETAISLLLAGHQAQTQRRPPYFRADKLKEDAQAAEEFIESQSQQAGIKMMQYIYGEDQRPEPRHDGRRKWSGWEI